MKQEAVVGRVDRLGLRGEHSELWRLGAGLCGVVDARRAAEPGRRRLALDLDLLEPTIELGRGDLAARLVGELGPELRQPVEVPARGRRAGESRDVREPGMVLLLRFLKLFPALLAVLDE